MAKRQRSETPFDFENAVVGQPGPDGSPVLRTFTTNGIPGVETRSEDGYRRLTFPLSALRRQPLVRMTPPPPKKEPRRRPARVARMLALVHDLQGKLDRGEYRSRASLAKAVELSPARVSQLLELTLLASDIQEEVLFLEAVDGREPLTERDLRRVLASSLWSEQRRRWAEVRFETDATPADESRSNKVKQDEHG